MWKPGDPLYNIYSVATARSMFSVMDDHEDSYCLMCAGLFSLATPATTRWNPDLGWHKPGEDESDG